EMTVFAMANAFVLSERTVPYGVRPEGSESKLSTFRDGFRVLRTIGFLYKDLRPLLFFGSAALLAGLASLGFGAFVFHEFSLTGEVSHPSTAVLAAALALTAFILLATGLILDTVNR
ncbi:glycosyl transferase, partial [Lysobacter sp. 2RAB21]